MERQLWPQLYHLIMATGGDFRLRDSTFQPHIVALVLLWAALHDRPMRWACRASNWSTTTLRPATLPSEATVSRRRHRVDTAVFLRALLARARGEARCALAAIIDAKPLPVGGASGDREARCGRGAGFLAKGYKLYAVWAGRPAPEVYRVYSMNVSEYDVAKEMLQELDHGGYLLGDGEYDAGSVYEAAAAAGDQLVAAPGKPNAGCGHRRPSAARRRGLELIRTDFGRALYRVRRGIERAFAGLTGFGGGLAPLPAWVRHLHSVWTWVTAKLAINAVRLLAGAHKEKDRDKELAA